jgi:hypothetical protein
VGRGALASPALDETGVDIPETSIFSSRFSQTERAIAAGATGEAAPAAPQN